MSIKIEIRRFAPDEGAELRRIRLEGLADSPTAFASTWAHEA